MDSVLFPSFAQLHVPVKSPFFAYKKDDRQKGKLNLES